MNEKYKAIYSLEPDGYTKDCLLLICGGNLLCNPLMNAYYVQLKLQNLQERVVSKVQFRVAIKDRSGEIIESIPYCYDHLHAAIGQTIGEQNLIPISSSRGSSFFVVITEVGFEDGTAMELPYSELEHLPAAGSLRSYLGDDAELEKQYRK